MGAENGARSGGNSTGIVRHIDDLGRIVIPSEIRKRLGLAERDALEISNHDEAIRIARPHSTCVFCGDERELVEHRGRRVCRPCAATLAGA